MFEDSKGRDVWLNARIITSTARSFGCAWLARTLTTILAWLMASTAEEWNRACSNLDSLDSGLRSQAATRLNACHKNTYKRNVGQLPSYIHLEEHVG